MEQFPLIIKPLSGEVMKIFVTKQMTIGQLKSMIVERRNNVTYEQVMLLFNKQQLKDEFPLTSFKGGDQLILMIKMNKSNSVKIEEEITLNTAEDYKQKVNELIELGHKREDVVLAIQRNNNNYQKALLELVNGKKRVIEEEQQDQQLSAEQQRKILLKEPLVKELMNCVESTRWHETLIMIGEKNSKIYNQIVSNLDGFIQELSDKTKYQEVNNDDLNTIFQLRTLNSGLSDEQMLRIYYKNNKDADKTIDEINDFIK